MTLRNIRLVYRKELLDIIRDRRTIISMIVVPILIFPIITIGFSALMTSVMIKTKGEIQKVAVVNADSAPGLVEAIESSGKLEIVVSDSVEQAILSEKIHAAVILPDDFQGRLESLDSVSVVILMDETESKSEFAAQKLGGILADYRRGIIESRLQKRGFDFRVADPFEIKTQNVASKEKMGSFILSLILPYMILILSLTGAMYTAMDLTAGEKERGTLETILTSPIPRWQLATGKLLTILTTSIVATILSIVSLTATMAYAVSSGGAMGGNFALHVTPASVIVIALMMIPTATLFSAVLMSISLAAKTYKEAQSYVSPFMMVVIMPAMVSFLPGIELGPMLALIPFVNVSLCIKEALLGNINPLIILEIFASTAFYAGCAIFVAHRLFERESVLFGG
jgi:sodium transport system permease protein